MGGVEGCVYRTSANTHTNAYEYTCSDADSNLYGHANTDRYTHTNTNEYACSDSDANQHTHPNANRYLHADSNSYAYPNSHADADSNRNLHTYTNAHSHGHTDSDSHSDAYTHFNRNPHADFHANADQYAHSGTKFSDDSTRQVRRRLYAWNIYRTFDSARSDRRQRSLLILAGAGCAGSDLRYHDSRPLRSANLHRRVSDDLFGHRHGP